MIKEKELVITNNLNRSTISLDNVIRILNSKFFNKFIFNLLVSVFSHLKVFSNSTHHRMALQLLRLSRFKSILFFTYNSTKLKQPLVDLLFASEST